MSTSQPLEPGDRRAGNRPGGRWSAVDRGATVVLLAILAVAAAALFRFGALVGMQADVCADDGVVCDFSRITSGVLITRWGPLALLVLATVLAIVRMRRRRISFFIPLLGIVAIVGVLLLGGAVVDGGIGRS